MTTYSVTAKRWEHGWELHIDGVGVTQCTGLTGAERAARDYVAIVIGGEPASFDVEITPELDEEIGEELVAAKRETREAERLQREAALRYRKVARTLRRKRHLSGADTAAVMGVSEQRVSQLVKE